MTHFEFTNQGKYWFPPINKHISRSLTNAILNTNISKLELLIAFTQPRVSFFDEKGIRGKLKLVATMIDNIHDQLRKSSPINIYSTV